MTVGSLSHTGRSRGMPSFLKAAVVLLGFLLASASAFAQEASVVGILTYESKSVLPGVTVTAVSVDTGRQFTIVTSEKGEYAIPGIPAGRYKVTAELSGFAPTRVDAFEVLVGQNASLP